jgi:phasin
MTMKRQKTQQPATKTPSKPRRKHAAKGAPKRSVTRSLQMNEHFTRQAQDMFNAAKDVRIPENFQALAEDSVVKTREAYQKINTAAKDSAKVIEEVMLAAHAGAKAIGEKVLQNTVVNTEAAFDAAQAIARARTLPEAARLQADFVQQQLAAAGAQSRELLELSTKVAKQTFETVNAAASKSFEQMKKNS